MKMIYIDNVRIPSERAHAYQIVQWCYEMGKLGHEITLVTPDRAEEKDLFEYYHLKKKTFAHLTLATFDALRYQWIPQRLAYVIQRYTFFRSVQKWAKGQRADIWYTRSPAVIDALSSQQERAWVLEVHDDPCSNQKRWERIKNTVRKYIAISAGMKAYLSKEGIASQNIIVAQDGVDLEAVERAPFQNLRSSVGIPKEAFLAIYTGGLYPWKGVDFFVDAWQVTMASAHLLVIGGPSTDRYRIEKRVPESARTRVHILPALPREQIFSWLKEADLGILPTSPYFAIGREYTSPLKVFEYLAAGLPVFASDVPSSHEVLTEQVAKFFSQEQRSVEEGIAAIMRDSAWRKSASMQAKMVAHMYSWEARVKTIEVALKSIQLPS